MATSKDFSRPAGPRIRIAMARYEARTRNFKGVKNHAALVNVADAAEQRRLWAAVLDTIADESRWRNAPDSRGGDSPATAGTDEPTTHLNT